MEQQPKKRLMILVLFYKDTIDSFEVACLEYMHKIKDLIKKYHPLYASTRLLNDADYLRYIILGGNKFESLLTLKEVHVVWLYSHGYAPKTIAYMNKVSLETVKFHCKNARHKLQAKNMAHAVLLAVKKGYIDAYSPIFDKEGIYSKKDNYLKYFDGTNLSLINHYKDGDLLKAETETETET